MFLNYIYVYSKDTGKQTCYLRVTRLLKKSNIPYKQCNKVVRQGTRRQYVLLRGQR